MTCDGLLPGETYAAWMSPLAGQFVYVEFPAEVGALALERQAGAAIRGRVRGRPGDASRVRMDVQDDRLRRIYDVRPDSEGRFEIEGLPDSTWTVHAWCRAADGVVWHAKGTVATGREIELRLAPRPPDKD